VSGEIVVLENDSAGRIAAFVQTLGRLPGTPEWVLIGGLAVNVRVARLHRATNDVDTVSGDQPGLVEIMVASGADQLSAGKVQFHDPEVEVDVMPSTDGDELPLSEEERVFALVRRWTMRTASRLSLGVVDETGRIVATTDLFVASRAALITLKAVSIPRRRQGSYPEKIGSDIQDLFRLVDGQDLEALAGDFDSLDEEAHGWVATMLTKNFSRDGDLRYNLARLRRYAGNLDAQSITEDDMAVVSELGSTLLAAADQSFR
jgi:hypothetical protein